MLTPIPIGDAKNSIHICSTPHTHVCLCCAVHMHIKSNREKRCTPNETTMRASERAIGIHRKFIWEAHTHTHTSSITRNGLYAQPLRLQHQQQQQQAATAQTNNNSAKALHSTTQHNTAHIKYIMFTMFLYFASARYIHCSFSVYQPNESSNKT